MAYIILALAGAWHAAAFGAGGIFVYFSYLALFGHGAYEPLWGKIIRHADVHLWLSGIVIIVIGLLLSGAGAYFTNPKLWAKITVIVFWFASTQYMRRVALPLFRSGKRGAMLACSSINVSCWIYGAFLGCAKGLAYGKASFSALIIGFTGIMLACFIFTVMLERRFMRKRAELHC